MAALSGRIALVAGATRGAGRGIATALGELGATVYCSGRSVRGHPAGTRPETIEDTADRVTAAGGKGIPVQTDHTMPEQVRALTERILREQGRLDILVNDVWGGDELTEWGKPLWEHSLEKGLLMQQRAVHSHLITSRFAIPLMLDRPGALLVEVTDGVGDGYRGNLYYDLAKASVIRIAMALGYELRTRNVTALAVTPGFLRSGAMLEHHRVTEATWRDYMAEDPNWAESETPMYVGRCVAALAADPEVWRFNGGVYASWDLAERYGIEDVDGRRPHWGRHIGVAVDAQWEALVSLAQSTFAATTPGVAVAGDRGSLTLAAGPASRRVLEPELFFTEPAAIVGELFQRFVRATSTAHPSN